VSTAEIEQLWRREAPRVLGALVHRYGDFHRAEDAMQDALVAASVQWPRDGVPDDPGAWLIRAASRRLIDRLRSDDARARREEAVVAREPAGSLIAPAADEPGPSGDDTLTVLLLCCHPALTPPSQVALTLRAVGGLTTAEIARAFLVPEATMAQRISRAKQAIREAGARFRPPPGGELPERMRVVLHVLYLIFNEGYTATGGTDLHRPALAAEAIRLTRMAYALLPDDDEVAGLLALMLLTDARSAARTRPDGLLVPLAEQDRGRWDAGRIAEGVALLTGALSRGPAGPYQVQAAIAAVHAEAPSSAETDWPQIAALYRVLERLAPAPTVTLNRAVAVAMADGPQAGLALVATLADDPRMARHHRLHAVLAHLLESAGDRAGAREEYLRAARLTLSVPEQRYLTERADRL